jgi:hypothetical protein
MTQTVWDGRQRTGPNALRRAAVVFPCARRLRYNALQHVPQHPLIALGQRCYRRRSRIQSHEEACAQPGAGRCQGEPFDTPVRRVRATLDQAARFEVVDQPGDVGRIGFESLRELAHRNWPFQVKLV